MPLPPFFPLFFFNDTATTEIYTLSLHDALPIFRRHTPTLCRPRWHQTGRRLCAFWYLRSEEHTSELQSRRDLVCRLLLEKKKNSNSNITLPSSNCITSTTNR